MKKKKVQKVKIEFEVFFGTDFQEETHINSLNLILLGWKTHVEGVSKKNKVSTITVEK